MALFRNKVAKAANMANIEIPRSVLPLEISHKTTFNVGDLIPVLCMEVLPGQGIDLNLSEVVRGTTPVFPVMDNAFLEASCFFVPARLVDDNWQAFNGENTVAPWANTTQYTIPAIPAGTVLGRYTAPNGVLTPQDLISDNTPIFPFSYDSEDPANFITPVVTSFKGYLSDYFGLPIANVSSRSVASSIYENSITPIDIRPFRGYGFIWSEDFRNQNVTTPLLIQKGPYSPSLYTYGQDIDYPLPNSDNLPFMKPLRVSKFHDMFTDALPAPQKGSDVLIPGLDGIPVGTSATDTFTGEHTALHYRYNNGAVPAQNHPLTHTGTIASSSSAISSDTSGGSLYPSNLQTVLGTSSGATIGALRTAFQIQKVLERDSYGTRYVEVLKNHFGVTSPDARLQRPEYLGGIMHPLNMRQVVQTSSTDSTSPQGNVSGISVTSSNDFIVSKDFVEHGWLYVLVYARTENTYQNGLARMWSRRTRFDYYMPEFSNITNQPIYQSEVYGTYASNSPGQVNPLASSRVFGYKEAWDEYRHPVSYVTGSFRKNVKDSLYAWTYAQDYAGAPFLSTSWMYEDPADYAQTLAVTDAPQLIGDFYFHGKNYLPMPTRSIPGLVDHF